ncbi:uncharacterized protein LOC125237036 [Leguminivora glycinivorella]|uniref:uncharacterized protein LOC125237036 n=1 Tax=Leguminivora glycinivorella TaxID=1035111 RepID=UPI00200E8156|nr:uncharacterized protein LOC125237036 [Leguminivora glycinivorella]
MYNARILLPVILFILSKTHAQIEIHIQVSDSNEVTVQTTGQSETRDLNANHRELFHITDELLQKALFTLTGLQTEVFLDSNNDVYKNYELEPVKTVLKPNGTKTKVIQEEIILNKVQTYNEYATENSRLIILKGNIEDNVTCVFKQKDVFPAEILHIIDVNSIDKNWSIASNFGRDFSETNKDTNVNATFGVTLGAKKDATAILSATKVTVLIQINYLATLTGNILAKFDSSYVWGYEHYDIKTIMDEAGMPHSVRLSEEIRIEFYTNCSINVYGDNVFAMNSETQCLFTVKNVTDDENINWVTGEVKNKKLTSKGFPKVLKQQGNNAVKNSVTSILFVTLFTII